MEAFSRFCQKTTRFFGFLPLPTGGAPGDIHPKTCFGWAVSGFPCWGGGGIPLPDGILWGVLVFVKKKEAFLWDLPLPNGGSLGGHSTPKHALAGLLVVPCDATPDGFYERSRFCKKKDAFLWILPLPMVCSEHLGGHSPKHALAGLLVDFHCDTNSLDGFYGAFRFL